MCLFHNQVNFFSVFCICLKFLKLLCSDIFFLHSRSIYVLVLFYLFFSFTSFRSIFSYSHFCSKFLSETRSEKFSISKNKFSISVAFTFTLNFECLQTQEFITKSESIANECSQFLMRDFILLAKS